MQARQNAMNQLAGDERVGDLAGFELSDVEQAQTKTDRRLQEALAIGICPEQTTPACPKEHDAMEESCQKQSE